MRTRSPVATGLIGKGTELLSQLLLLTAIPAALGPGDYGDFALAMAVVGIGSAAMSLGGLAVMTRFLPAADPDERDAVARALTGSLARLQAVLVVAFATAAAVVAIAAPGTFSPLATALVVTALAFDVGASVLFQTALGFGHAGLYSFRFPLQNLLLVGTAISLHAAFGTIGAVAAIAVSSAVAFGAGVAAVMPRLLRAHRGRRIPAGAVRFGATQAISGLLTYVQQRGGVVAVAALHGSRVETGFASIAIGVALAPLFAVQQAFAAHLPSLVEGMGDDPTAAEQTAQRVARRLEPPLLAIAIAGAVWGADLLVLVAGSGFRGAADALIPAFALLPLIPLVALGAQVAALRLQPEARLRAVGAGLVAFLVVATAAVPGTGAVGATTALLAGTSVTAAGFALALPGLLTIGRATAIAAAVALVLVTGVLL